MLKIDGSMGEGGGQVLRTCLSLSLITGTAFHGMPRTLMIMKIIIVTVRGNARHGMGVFAGHGTAPRDGCLETINRTGTAAADLAVLRGTETFARTGRV